jgi:adenylate cyclase
MSTGGFKRKLAAVLSADVSGYSRLMGDNEEETVRTLKAYREVMGTLIGQHRGRVIDSPGDNILAEFASVVDALRSAWDIQKEIQARNSGLPEGRRMVFRIGINLGDVIEEEGRIYGDGVNVAARMENLAEAGGITISGTAYDQVKNKLPMQYAFQGEQAVKNIAEPVRIYRVVMEPGVDTQEPVREKPSRRRKWGWAGIGAAALLLLGAVSVTVWHAYFSPAPPPEKAPAEWAPKLALPDKPSIAVLPFSNMSGDPEQEYFSDGVTEEIITALSKVPRLFVIARNSTFTYKGKPVMVQQVAQDLGVRYVLEGSVRKEKDRVRITAQLIDAMTGNHLWGEKYDRDLKDIFAVQDEITFKVIAALQVKLTEGEQALIMSGGTKSFEGYTKFLQGLEYVKRFNKEGNLLARKMAEEAIALDPNYPRGYRLLATTHLFDVRIGASKSPKESMAKAAQLYQKVIAMDPSDAQAHALLGIVLTLMRQYENGMAAAEQAVAINPNVADSQCWYGYILSLNGRHQEALEAIKKAFRLNPLPQDLYWLVLVQAYCHLGMYEEAIATGKEAIRRQPDSLLGHLRLAMAYALSGRENEARAEVNEVLRINPRYSVEYYRSSTPFKNPADMEFEVNALLKAGLPRTPPLPLPDKPSIAVLPFLNMSDDKSQEYFSDGLTEEIITALSKTPKLFVIARNSTFVYKGQPVNVQQVGRELGVKYLLEGSVRRSGDALRITAQLIDTATGNHLWAERYDRRMKDIFIIQDEVTLKILTSLQVALTEGEQATFFSKGTKSLEAYLKCLEARELLLQLNKDDNALSIQRCEEAIALDPKYPRAFATLSTAHCMNFYYRVDPPESLKKAHEKAHENAQKALALDDMQLAAYIALEFVNGWKRQYDEAIAAGEKAVKVAPGCADAYLTLGRALNMACRDQEAIEYVQKAIRMNPFPPTHYYMHLGFANFHLRNHEAAVSAFKRALAVGPKNQPARGALIATYVEMDRMDEARTETEEFLKIDPNWTSKGFEKMSPYKDPEVTRRRAEAWRKVGLERDIAQE